LRARVHLHVVAKQDRLRQAKAEADREIAAYRAEREGAYQKKVAEVRAAMRLFSWGCARA
jgi:hypothetical protein